MIPINLIQSTAETLMDKAAIEIPQDYLDGLQNAAQTEDGDLSSFVLKAMLENYEAAVAARRYAYDTLGWTRPVSYIHPDNARSIALAERLGCVRDPNAACPFPETPDLVFRHPEVL